jgi:adenylate cyclase
MGFEIERKFLTCNEDWKQNAVGTLYRQGYLSRDSSRSVRVRVSGQTAMLNIKGAKSTLSRVEYEYPISVKDAQHLLDELCERPLIEKTRYEIQFEGMLWEVDEFHGENEGLVVAEIELTSEDQAFAQPAWLGAEVSHDARYLNINLIQNPYSKWKNEA